MIEIFHSFDRKDVVPLKSFKFSGGEIQVEVGLVPIPSLYLRVRAHLTSSDEIFTLMLVVDALRRQLRARNAKSEDIHLECAYLPYARQDRVMNPGEALSLRVMCDLINGMNFKTVSVWDVHSDVALALLNNVNNYGPETFVREVPADRFTTILVAPDAGAIKKVFKVSEILGFLAGTVTASKHRSTKDGSITETEVHCGHVGDNDFLIVDDLCDGGATYIGYTKSDGTKVPGLVQALRPLTNGKIYMYFTHGIFSKGLDVFHGLVDGIYVAKPFPGVDLTHPLLHVLPSGV